MKAYLRGYPEFFGETPVRDVGLIASEGRMTIPIEDGTPAGLLDIRHHYFEFIPEDQADREQPETVEATELIEGRNYFIVLTTAGGLYRYNISDLVRCVGYHGSTPLIEFLNKGAHYSSLTGEKLSEHQVIAAVQAAQQHGRLRASGRISCCRPGPSRRITRCWSRKTTWTAPTPPSGSPRPSRRSSGARTSNTPTARTPAGSAQSASSGSAAGSWSEFQKRRLARSGGAVEQYKQPHLIPDLDQIAGFQPVETVGT